MTCLPVCMACCMSLPPSLLHTRTASCTASPSFCFPHYPSSTTPQQTLHCYCCSPATTTTISLPSHLSIYTHCMASLHEREAFAQRTGLNTPVWRNLCLETCMAWRVAFLGMLCSLRQKHFSGPAGCLCLPSRGRDCCYPPHTLPADR